MSTLEYILLFTLLGSIGGLAGGLTLILNKEFALKVSHVIAAFAAGTFLGAAFFDLLPQASHEAEKLNINIYSWVLLGIIFFFIIERFIHWFHHHEKHHEHQKETKSTVPLIIIGDTIHNFVDGVVIAATFLVSVPLGIVTTFAVFAHELPQEIGDFGLLLHKGLTRKKVILVNILSASSAFLGAILTYILGDFFESYIPILLALTAGFFIYIATSDLIPEINYEKRKGLALVESLLLVVGILIIYVAVTLFRETH